MSENGEAGSRQESYARRVRLDEAVYAAVDFWRAAADGRARA
jgi:hypothetical protein